MIPISKENHTHFTIWMGIVVLIVMAVICSIIILSSKSESNSSNDVDYVTLTEEELLSLKNCYDFSKSEAISINSKIEADEMVYTSKPLLTNSGRISITNNGEGSLNVELYYEDDMDDCIQSKTVEPGVAIGFEGLTHAEHYYVGIAADAETEVNVLITD